MGVARQTSMGLAQAGHAVPASACGPWELLGAPLEDGGAAPLLDSAEVEARETALVPRGAKEVPKALLLLVLLLLLVALVMLVLRAGVELLVDALLNPEEDDPKEASREEPPALSPAKQV